MSSFTWTLIFATALVASLALRAWLATRQIAHVARHSDEVPASFRAAVGLEAHRKAADYTLAKSRLGLLQMIFAAVVLLGWTLFGGLDALNVAVRDALLPRFGGLPYEMALLASFFVVSGLLELPFELYATFRIEERFGFNRTHWRLYVADQLKGIVVGALIGLPLAALVLWIMAATGPLWWLWAWATWMAVGFAAQIVYPTFIAPLFNRFEELSDPSVKTMAQALMARVGFAAKGLFVMDGSRRSAHANAYFTGFGKAKRVVFFDTLLARLAPAEIEAVLAHELGHFKLHHIRKRIVSMALLTLAFFALLGWLSTRVWFFTASHRAELWGAERRPGALAMMLAASAFTIFATPVFARLARKDEFEADAFACAQADAGALASALLKLHEDNASTLTPDPLFARFYYSHPPAVERLAALPLGAIAPA